MADDEIKIMNTQEVATRALVLFGIWLLNTPTPRHNVVHWIKANNLWTSLSQDEINFAKTKKPTEKQKINFSWHIERLYVLAWALGEVSEMVPANQQGSITEFQDSISPLNDNTAKNYLQKARLRSETEILDMADEIQRLHWEARNARIHNSNPSDPVDMEIIQERHHAINWILWGHEEDWDDISTDT